MHVIIVTDIFGINSAVERLALGLRDDSAKVTIVDPYEGTKQTINSEQVAYDWFLSECGHKKLCSKVKEQLRREQKPTTLIGFSAGASAAWKALESIANGSIQHFIGFYPSQIRHHLDIEPNCPSTLIFPAQEDHFDLNPVITRLSSKTHVRCIKTSYLHGFMNPQSKNFNPSAASFYFPLLTSINHLLNVDQFFHVAKAQVSTNTNN